MVKHAYNCLLDAVESSFESAGSAAAEFSARAKNSLGRASSHAYHQTNMPGQ